MAGGLIILCFLPSCEWNVTFESHLKSSLNYKIKIIPSESDFKVDSTVVEHSFSVFSFNFEGAVKRQKRVAINYFNLMLFSGSYWTFIV